MVHGQSCAVNHLFLVTIQLIITHCLWVVDFLVKLAKILRIISQKKIDERMLGYIYFPSICCYFIHIFLCVARDFLSIYLIIYLFFVML